MKKIFQLTMLVAATLLASCSGRQSDLERVQAGEPIMPIHMGTGDTHIYLTDYLPSLPLNEIGKMSVEEYTMTIGANFEELDLSGHSRYVQTLTVGDGKTEVAIPVLPHHSYYQGMTTLDCTKKSVTIGFVGEAAHIVHNPHFVVLVQNRLLKDAVKDNEDGTYTINLKQAKKVKGLNGRTYLRVYAADSVALYNDILVPLQDGKPVTEASQLTRHDVNNQILYSLMIDRFENGNPTNDEKLNQPDVLDRVDYQGGDLAGITKKINEGWFDQLGVNTLWISPITQNPHSAWGQYTNPDTKFSGYHGYWPIFNTKIDNRFGTDAELKEMLASAHAHNINVVLDYVANHMHIQSPTLQEHPDWVTDSLLPDGRRNFELWDEARLTTWFDKHIPSLDLERPEVCDAMTDTALYWVSNYDFDGYRHDACKHIPLDYWRMFTHKMKSRFPERPLWMIGETYGDPELIGSYVKTGMLNAQFDFNIYHTAVDVLGKEGVSMRRMARVVEQSLAAYGDHHTMGNISGNHDKCRFISLAGGAVSWDENDKDAGWHRSIGVTADGDKDKEEIAYRKALLLEVINFGIPGVPCVYQGDEYGQPGANDPDNRRMMRFEGLNEREQAFRKDMEVLIAMRRTKMPLIYGDYNLLLVDDVHYVFSRTYMGETITFVINNSADTFHYDQIDVQPYGWSVIGI